MSCKNIGLPLPNYVKYSRPRVRSGRSWPEYTRMLSVCVCVRRFVCNGSWLAFGRNEMPKTGWKKNRQLRNWVVRRERDRHINCHCRCISWWLKTFDILQRILRNVQSQTRDSDFRHRTPCCACSRTANDAILHVDVLKLWNKSEAIYRTHKSLMTDIDEAGGGGAK